MDYEKLGVFYLGRIYDPGQRAVTQEPYLYDAKDLTTHAIVIGMTGSGKTGLCVNLLEEAAIDGIPAIAIDPKGDISNLMLMFPNLAPADFQPWIDPAEATRQGMTVDEFAKATAEKWKKGLADWDQQPDRIARVMNAAEVAIYTPGSNAGLSVSVLRSLAVPPAAILQDADALRQRISSAVAGLLALLGVGGDALESRENILIATIIDRAWRAGQDVQIPTLLRQIQTPPFDKVGFLDLESFFPSADRFALVTRLNNLFASPAFAGWMEGEPLDVAKLLNTPQGKPRISIMSIAHLSDSERMFFVTILLNEVLSWMRTQPGTSSLRAILYMDEIFGYFPPTANPPSKTPMLTLLKQARAYGVGVVLATQNPVDLDYKGMANTGSWFLGRLQTERDKQRVLDGLEGASTSAGFSFDRASVEATLSGLPGRTFLVNNIHENQPVQIQTRWAMSYLRGPMTRDQIQRLMAPRLTTPAGPALAGAPAPAATPAAPAGGDRPMIPPGIEELFLSARPGTGAKLVYRPGLIGMGQAHYVQKKNEIDLWEKIVVLHSLEQEVPHPAWEGALLARDAEIDLLKQPEAGIPFATLPNELSVPKNFTGWVGELKQYLYRHLQLTLHSSELAGLTSNAREKEGEFKVRVRDALSVARDRGIEKIRTKYAPKLARIQEKMRKVEQRIDKEKAQANQSVIQAVLSMAGTVLGAIFGRKMASVTNVGRASTSVRSAGKVLSDRGDVARAQEDLETLKEEFDALEAEVAAEVDKVKEAYCIDPVETVAIPIRPRKADLAVTKVALVWTPWSVDATGIAQQAYDFEGESPGEVAGDAE
jgi:hypothetical protein